MATPDTVATLNAWWKADSLALSNGAAVATWTDSSGGAADATQATGTAQPLFQTAQVNGLPVVRFDGTDDHLVSTASSSLTATTVFAVVKPANVANYMTIRGSDIDNGLQFRLDNTGKMQMVAENIALVGTATTTLSTTLFQVATISFTSGASYNFYLNGTADGGTTTGVSIGASATTSIARNLPGGGESFNGDIAEIIVYSSVLSTGDRATVHSYLADKYGITVSDYVGGSKPTYVSDRGTAANATAATTTSLTLTSPTSIAVGNYLIARVAVDNSGTNGAAPGCTVTDPRSNTWTVLGPALSDPGAASAGATAYLCYAKVITAYQAADALTFNWGGVSTTAKAIVVEEWSNIHKSAPVAVTAVTANSVTAASTTAVSTGVTPTAPAQLVYTCLATEGIAADTVGADADTTNGTWVTLTTTASANATATNNQRVSGQYKVVSAAGTQSWDVTITSRDWAAIAVVFAPLPSPPPPDVRRMYLRSLLVR